MRHFRLYTVTNEWHINANKERNSNKNYQVCTNDHEKHIVLKAEYRKKITFDMVKQDILPTNKLVKDSSFLPDYLVSYVRDNKEIHLYKIRYFQYNKILN